MRHVLIVAFHYPPEASSSGVLRTLKYTRYLAQFGWRSTVITTDVSAYDVTNDQLLEQIPDDVRVIRTRFVNSKRHLAISGRYPAVLAIPDNWIGWWPWAVSAGKRVLKSDPPDVVYSTSPHATAHLIAARLARLAKLPFVTDFRDPWHEEPPEPGTPTVVARAAKWLERRVIARSDRVVASTYGLRDTLRRRYSEEAEDKICAIVNGYDEADFKAIEFSKEPGSELLIVHAGNINREFRDPRPMFRAVHAAHQEGALDVLKIRFRFIGAGGYADSDEVKQCLRDCGLTGRVEFLPRMPYEEALKVLGSADILLLLQASEDTRDLVPAKLYEYLRAQRPVLALVFEGASEDVMRETGGGWSVNPRDAVKLQAAVSASYSAWNDQRLDQFTASREVLKRFDRRTLTKELVNVLEDAIARHKRVQ